MLRRPVAVPAHGHKHAERPMPNLGSERSTPTLTSYRLGSVVPVSYGGTTHERAVTLPGEQGTLWGQGLPQRPHRMLLVFFMRKNSRAEATVAELHKWKFIQVKGRSQM